MQGARKYAVELGVKISSRERTGAGQEEEADFRTVINSRRRAAASFSTFGKTFVVSRRSDGPRRARRAVNRQLLTSPDTSGPFPIHLLQRRNQRERVLQLPSHLSVVIHLRVTDRPSRGGDPAEADTPTANRRDERKERDKVTSRCRYTASIPTRR